MIHSMTGYGDAQLDEDGVRYAIEIRSLNNRYFKPTIKVPEHDQYLESEIEKLLRLRLDRGSIFFSLRVRNARAEAAYEVNTAALQAYLERMANVGNGNVQVTVDLGSMLSLPGVCQPPEMDESRRTREWETVRRLTEQALEKMIAMRAVEGKALRDDLVGQCTSIRERLAKIRTRAPAVIEVYHDRLRTRVDTLLSTAELRLSETDLMREVAVFADRCDISEEVSRLASHLDQFIEMCDGGSQAGRRLEFLAQEMLREANTIAAKANDLEIAREVVEIKGLIDRLKEQAQNVE